ncbi:MAG: ATP synthase F1 subunit gamma [Chloroflexi bacterium]|nr:ATP synthase F1 subunit gamma [Chloroflexota bacterium]
MPSLRDIRRRIRGIRNTAQITKAMELVAASRMRRAQQRVIAARPYAETMRTFIGELASIANGSADVLHPLLVQRDVDTVGIILLTTDRGLCGALNTNTIRRGTELILDQTEAVELLTIGRKGQDFMARRGYKIFASVTGIGDRPSYDQVIPIARNVMESYMAGRMDICYVVYPQFVSTLTQRPVVQQILPIATSEHAGAARPIDYIFEPNPQTILEQLLPRYVEVLIWEAILETSASEQSARMVAMRNANENAQDLIKDLTLVYNKTRQAGITREVTEIASAAEFMAAQNR